MGVPGPPQQRPPLDNARAVPPQCNPPFPSFKFSSPPSRPISPRWPRPTRPPHPPSPSPTVTRAVRFAPGPVAGAALTRARSRRCDAAWEARRSWQRPSLSCRRVSGRGPPPGRGPLPGRGPPPGRAGRRARSRPCPQTPAPGAFFCYNLRGGRRPCRPRGPCRPRPLGVPFLPRCSGRLGSSGSGFCSRCQHPASAGRFRRCTSRMPAFQSPAPRRRERCSRRRVSQGRSGQLVCRPRLGSPSTQRCGAHGPCVLEVCILDFGCSTSP